MKIQLSGWAISDFLIQFSYNGNYFFNKSSDHGKVAMFDETNIVCDDYLAFMNE